MLKIKSNTNEFTIIFSEKIRRKIHAEKLSVQPSLFSTLSLFQPSFSFSFSAAHFFFFLFQPFLVSASPFFCFSLFFFSFLPALLFFSVHVCLAFQPKAILSSAQKLFFQPKTFLLQPKTFFSSAQSLFFSLERFCFSPKPFSIQPTSLFQPLFVLFQLFFFLLVLFSAHLFFLFSTSFSSFFFSASFSFSCQLPRPKIFSLDASHFFYLNKSLFSSNLE